MAISLNAGNFNVKSKITPSISEKITKYTIAYSSGIEEYTNTYTVQYTSYGLVSVAQRYIITYDSLYGDVVSKYILRYYSGRESEIIDTRYTFRYTVSNPEEVTTTYSILYTTTGPSTINYRSIYRLRYDSQGVNEVVTPYSMRYTLEYFKERSDKYYIRYTTETPFMFDTQALLLRNTKKTSALFYLKGRKEFLEDMLFVFSNLPKYQLVEFGLEIERPHITIISPDAVAGYNLFGEQFESEVDTYLPACYVLVENVEEVNSLSLDLYEKITLEKRNINKSFFFNLDSTEFYTNPVNINGENYEKVNYSSDYYNYKYLNFTEKSVTPIFKVFDNCCFNNKITDTSSNACSPF